MKRKSRTDWMYESVCERVHEYGKHTIAFNEKKWMRFSFNGMIALGKIVEEAETTKTALNNFQGFKDLN